MWTSCLFLALFVAVQGRAVNISNTWVLPEEGFPVFYRYFRDRISWYEADAVCQFHHANLVTVDTTAQYDAVRAYLKELDISSAVWVGLIRSNPDGDFTWTDYRGLSGEGYWSSAPDSRTAPLCAAADPAADYRWEARACGGPSVASFICELPVPQWALGNEGCMVRALPALTVLYLPESAAVQLTADCGLAGVKRVQCTGNIKREDLLSNLSCVEEEQTSSPLNAHTTNWQATTDTSAFDQENSDAITDENTTSGREEMDQTNNMKSTPVQSYVFSGRDQFITKQYEPMYKAEKIKNMNSIENNNLNNNIPSIVFRDISSNEYTDRLEDERHIQHKQLHDELARLGNIETIFNQPTDHFVPPLVMAKSKLSNDMTALSFEEKLAQEHDDYQFAKHSDDLAKSSHLENYRSTSETPTPYTTNNVLISVTTSTANNDGRDKYTKKVMPKKYIPKYTKYEDSKRKAIPIMYEKKSFNKPTPAESRLITEASTVSSTTERKDKDMENVSDTSIELTVIIREPSNLKRGSEEKSNAHTTAETVPLLETDFNTTKLEQTVDATSSNIIVLNDEIINITFNLDHTNHSTDNMQVMEISTKMPIFQDDIIKQDPRPAIVTLNEIKDTNVTTELSSDVTEKNENLNLTEFVDNSDIIMTLLVNTSDYIKYPTDNTMQNNTSIVNPLPDINNNSQILTSTVVFNETVTLPSVTIETLDGYGDVHHLNGNSSEEDIDDFQSPLLSGANEPIHKPMRARRPQNSLNRAKKFNPFRILG